ncbi:MAG: DUF4340 domain-containing protein [Planctomycetota bacterium]|jgi:hypothetical protein|nr:DUF4340 domain-containing protein [Planctomycetota bacterium]MDP6938625.1 DUF4340 domain-containing protein [Planctomycetota bacterium]
MSRVTTALLALLVLGLGWGAWYQGKREDPDFGRREFALFEGLAPSRVDRIRVDNVERSLHLGLARDGRGLWNIVDPIAYPARQELVVALLRVAQNTAQLVPAEERELAQSSLSPPRAVMELHEVLEDGSERLHRVNMGAVDLDQMRVFAEVDGRILRTMRNLEVALENDLIEWRSRRVFEIDGKGVVSISRRGFDYPGDRQVPLELEVQRQQTNWFMERPVRVHGDPVAVGTWSQVLARLGVDQFVSDLDPPPLEKFGLHEPWFSLTLTDQRGEGQTVEFAARAGTYFCRRVGLPNIWTVDGRSLEAVFFDAPKLYDEALTRVFRGEIEKILLFRPDGALRLSRPAGDKSWSLARLDEAREWGAERPAEATAVEGILSTLEQEKVHDYLWEGAVSDYFEADVTQRFGVFVEAGGQRQGGWIGAAVPSESGTRQYAYLRERETAVGLVGSALHELLDVDPLGLLSRFVYTVDEIRLKRLVVSADGEERLYLRSVQGTWVYPNEDVRVRVEARELRPLLDHLTHLRAERHLAERAELTDVVEVKLLGAGGEETVVRIGLTESGEVRADYGQGQSVLAQAALHGDLLELLR